MFVCVCVCVGSHKSSGVKTLLSRTVTSLDFHSRDVAVGNTHLIRFLHTTGHKQ